MFHHSRFYKTETKCSWEIKHGTFCARLTIWPWRMSYKTLVCQKRRMFIYLENITTYEITQWNLLPVTQILKSFLSLEASETNIFSRYKKLFAKTVSFSAIDFLSSFRNVGSPKHFRLVFIVYLLVFLNRNIGF